MKAFRAIAVFSFLILVLGFPQNVYAKQKNAPFLDGEIVLGNTFVLESNETINGSLIVLGGVVTLEVDSFVDGDVLVLGGNITVLGEIKNSLIAFGGVVTISDTAIIYGDLIAPATVLKRAKGAQIFGDEISDTESFYIEIPDIPDLSPLPDLPEIPVLPQTPDIIERFTPFFSSISNVLWFFVKSFAFSAVAVIVVLFMPKNTERTRNAIKNNPLLSGGLGMISIFISAFLIIIFAIMIFLIPASILLVMILGFGLFYGWVVVGTEIGSRVAEALNHNWTLPVKAGLGTLGMSLIVNSLDFAMMGWMSSLIVTVVSVVGLGGVLLTRFGLQEYKNSSSSLSDVDLEVEDIKPVDDSSIKNSGKKHKEN